MAAGLGLFAIVAPSIYLDPVYPLPELVSTVGQRPAQEIHIRFGEDAFALQGFDVQRQESRGDQPGLYVTYYWQARRGAPQDLALFLQLVEPGASAPTVQIDTFPTYGALPTRVWPRDRILIDRVVLPLPPDIDSHSGTVITGLYDPVTLVRMPAYDQTEQRLANDAAVLGELRHGRFLP